MDKDTAIILTQTKSTGMACFLTLFFGGAGLFYVSILAGIIGLVIEIVCFFLGRVPLVVEKGKAYSPDAFTNHPQEG